MNRIAAVIVTLGAMSAGSARAQESPAETRRQMAAALEKATAKGGIVFKGTLDKKLEGAVMELAGGEGAEEVTGPFTLKMGRNGVAVALFEKPKMRLETYIQGGKSAQRLAWSGAAPAPGEIGEDLSRVLRWETLRKHVEKAKETGREEDADVGGAACRGFSCILSSDFFTAGRPDPEVETEGPVLKVSEVHVSLRVGKDDGVLRQIEFGVVRTLEGAEIEFRSRYTLTVETFDPALTVEVPADLRTMLE